MPIILMSLSLAFKLCAAELGGVKINWIKFINYQKVMLPVLCCGCRICCHNFRQVTNEMGESLSQPCKVVTQNLYNSIDLPRITLHLLYELVLGIYKIINKTIA